MNSAVCLSVCLSSDCCLPAPCSSARLQRLHPGRALGTALLPSVWAAVTAARLSGRPRGGRTQSFGSKVNKALILNKLAANPTYFWSSLSLNILRVCSWSEVSTESGAMGEDSSFISLFYNLLLQFQGRQIDGITMVRWCHSCRSVWSFRVWCGFVFTHWLFFCWSNSLFLNTSSHKVVSSQQMS